MENELKVKSLETAIQKLEKDYGKGTVMKLGEASHVDVDVIPTGSLGLDIALGIGGIPRGRIIEIYGPESSGKTTLALHMVAEAQKNGGIAAFIDAEHALDPKYAQNIGVNIDELYVSQPDNGEQALEIADAMIRSGAIDLIVVDSVAALVPKAEIDGEMGDAHVGLQARLLSQALRKITGSLSKAGCSIIFINQLREKVGVMFGCLHADTLIPFVDGRTLRIRDVVENKIEGEVWTYNEETGRVEARKITDWFYNGEVQDNSDYINIISACPDSHGGLAGVTVTPHHMLYTDSGWKEARNISIKDKLFSKYKSKVNGSLREFLFGMLAGDSHLSIRNSLTASLRIQDASNEDYCKWKIDKLSPFFDFNMVIVNSKKRYATNYSSELAYLKKMFGERDPVVMLKNTQTDIPLAVWYMDDGHYDSKGRQRIIISVKRFKGDKEKMEQIVAALKERGVECSYSLYDGSIVMNNKQVDEFSRRIAKYIPSSMQYKLPDKYKGQYEDFSLETMEGYKTSFVEIVQIKKASERQMRQRGKYDIEVEGNHNYISGGVSNGVLVHNSNEVTPGGRALKFYSSVRIDVRRIESLKQNGEYTGNRVRARIVKNKVAPPFKEAEFDIVFGKGIEKTGEIVDAAASLDIIQKSGAWYSYKGERIGQGREKAKAYLDDHPDISLEIEQAVKDAFSRKE